MCEFVSRAGTKLDHALTAFAMDVAGKICAIWDAAPAGFTDCLLQRGAAKVYAVDTGYGVLDWKLRKDPRVVVMERTNAMHVRLPEAGEHYHHRRRLDSPAKYSSRMPAGCWRRAARW